ncbi:abc1 family protein [hydrocarbon metagenome]|uniref:Abc1 family protein n=1 Tax=hydrocarbon metagenome TaxID=938273 RepID=A0A0W8E8F3_9ZZZZ
MPVKNSAVYRFLSVIRLFAHISMAFYSLRFKKYLHNSAWLHKKKEELYVTQARLFRETAVELGGLLIKLGQFISTRVDILPRATIQELSGLQDEVRPVDFEDIKIMVCSEFGQPLEDIYADIDTNPVASASLGQVHYGMLLNGREVAIKVMRPGIEELIKIDLRAVRQVIKWIKVFTDWERFIDLDAIYQEFEETLWGELDYLKEGSNAEVIAANSSEDKGLLVPEIMWEFTRTRVLTMEYMRGIKITDYKQIEDAGIDRKLVAAHLLNIYVRQILVDGFYHADPHPGNLFVARDGKLIMVDFGMVGSVSKELRSTLVDMVKAIVRRDHDTVVDYLIQLGFVHYRADKTTLTRAIALFLEHILGDAQEISKVDLHNFLQDLEQLLYEQPFQVPARFTFLGRALGTLYGICIGLDPDINFLAVSKPYVDELLGDGGGLYQVVKEKAGAWGSALIELPPLFERVLQKAERGDISIRIPLHQLQDNIADNTRSIKSVAWAVAFSSALLTSAYLLVNNLTRESYWGFGLTAVFLILLLISSRSRRGNRRAPHPPVMVKRQK